jgi:hypothetical protein
VNDDNMNLWIKTKGTVLSKDFAAVWVDFYFPKECDITKLMAAVHNHTDRLKWDKDVEVGEVIRVHNHQVLLWY